MAKLQNIPRRQIILLAIMVVIGLLLARQYLGFLKLPTRARLERAVKELESSRGDLKAATVDDQKRLQNLEELRAMSKDFWLSSTQRAPTDQEITREFNKLLRRAQLPANQKVDTQRNKLPGVANIQEVQIRLDLKNVTMREVGRLLAEVKKYGNRLILTGCWDARGELADPDVTEETVKASVRRTIETFAPGGGYMFQGSYLGEIGDEATAKKNRWIAEAYEEFGRHFYQTH